MIFTEVKEIEPKKESSSFGDVLNAVILSFLIFFIGLRIFPFLLFILPAPSIVLSYRKGIKYGLIASLILTVAIYFLESGSVVGVSFLLYLIPTVAIMSYLIKAGSKLSTIVIVNSATILLISIVVFFYFQIVMNVDVLAEISNYFDKFIKLLPQLLEQTGKENVETATKMMKEYSELFIRSIYSIVVIVSVGISYFSFIFSRNLLRKKNIILEQQSKFNEFRVKRYVIVPAAILAVVAFGLGYYKIQYSDIISLNIYILIKFLFTVLGVSVTDYYLSKKVNNFLRVFIPIVVFILGLEFIFFVIGLTDTLVDFRKITNRKLK